MNGVVEIFVSLPDEQVDVWRPIWARRLHDDVYRIVKQPYDRQTEKWEFEPGDTVVCEFVDSYDRRILAAAHFAPCVE